MAVDKKKRRGHFARAAKRSGDDSSFQLPSVSLLTASMRSTVWLRETNAAALPSTAAMQFSPS